MGRPVVLFDGVCNLCNASVLFVIDRDPRGHYAFAPLQGDEAAALLRGRGYHTDPENPASILLVENDRVYERSTAALRIARRLSGLWPAFSLLLAVPRPLRDAVYAR